MTEKLINTKALGKTDILKIEIDRTMRKDEVQWQTQLLQLQWKMEM